MRRGVRTALAATTLLVLAACGADDEPTAEQTSTPTPTESETPIETSGPLDWQPTGRSPDARVVVGERWTAIAGESDLRFESNAGDADDVVLPDDSGGSVDAVLLDGDSAVVSYGFGGETTSGLGYRVDLTTSEQTEIVTPEPANGGDWARLGDSVHYPGLGEGGVACLATLSVADGNGEDGWCPSGRVGIAELEANEDGVAVMLFDYASRVSCRTLALLDQSGIPQPVDGPAECTGWDIAATSTGIVWSEVTKPKRQEVAQFHARTDSGTEDLGQGSTGTLTSCGGDTFFVSDPATRTDPARLMRWDGAELSVAYESTSRGNAFLGRPECADGILTISSFGEDGDEQVSAHVG
ncbi:lipoprotein [Nocardioides currus]|uniref:Uncharacterized protein n=1 Tax=Nocardioides currus TaxID=2133958 RepID=A0A2R7YU45_9ACTN|nr:hypothetical protein [Nocardioides currus]PUA79861.1 hypothetical protein C7S10_17535 [Nocardioides currus]